MLKFLFVLLIDVAIGASLPQNPFILPPTPPPPPSYTRPRSSHSPHSLTHVRITRPQHYDPIIGTAQNPSQNIQFASSPTTDYYGGSVYSDGNGIVVRPQDTSSYSRHHYSQPDISYFPSSYSTFYNDRSLMDPYFSAGNYPPYSRGYEVSPSANMFNKPGIRAESSGLQYYSTQPMTAFAPQSRDLLMHGLGRVLPLNHMKKKRPVEVRSGADQEVLMFTLGRIMGQLNNMNNKTIPTPILQYALGLQPNLKPTNPWEDQITPSGNPWAVVPPSYQRWSLPTTPWWQPSFTPWNPQQPWWANVYQPQQQPSLSSLSTQAPWWFDMFMPSQPKDQDEVAD